VGAGGEGIAAPGAAGAGGEGIAALAAPGDAAGEASMTAPELVTIGFSHFCEKARWALDRGGLAYVESDHVPCFHVAASLREGGRRSVPVLKVGGRVLHESNDIVRFVDEALPPERRLFPTEPGAGAEVERAVAEFDAVLGPATRRFVYRYVFEHPALAKALLAGTGPAWERRLTPTLYPAMRWLMVRGMKITPAAAERARGRIEATFARADERLAGGGRYLVGDRFTAADLAFAALAAPVLAPPAYGHPLPPLDEWPPEVASFGRRLRDTDAGRFALRLYDEERPPVRGRRRAGAAA
jgi:glutathione S-transferase